MIRLLNDCVDDSGLTKGLLSSSELVKREGLVDAHSVADIQLMNRLAVIYSSPLLFLRTCWNWILRDTSLSCLLHTLSAALCEQYQQVGPGHATAQRHRATTCTSFPLAAAVSLTESEESLDR